MSEIFEHISQAVNLRLHFKDYILKSHSSIEGFKQSSDLTQIGIVLHFLAKLGLVINIYDEGYEIIFHKPEGEVLDNIISMRKMNITEYIVPVETIFNRQPYYALHNERMEGSIFQKYKAAIIMTIKFLDAAQFGN